MSENKYGIMVVDDQPKNLRIMENILEDDYNLLMASSGKECLEGIASFKPDLVLLDIMMPGQDGYEVCRKLHDDEQTRDIPVIFVSAKDTLEDRLKGYEEGAVDYFVKPFEHEELLQKIKKTIEYKMAIGESRSSQKDASRMALKAMTNASELGLALRFIKDSFTTKSYKELAEKLLEATKDFNISCSVQIRSPETVYTINDDGASTPLEEEILLRAGSKGRIYDSKNKTIYNFEGISLMVKDMPVEDQIRYGEIKDLICYLLEGAEARIKGIQSEMDLQKQKTYLMKIVEYANISMDNFNKDMHKIRMEGASIVEDMMDNMEDLITRLVLEESQEIALRNITENGLEKTTDLFNKGIQFDAEFSNIVSKLKGISDDELAGAQQLEEVFRSII